MAFHGNGSGITDLGTLVSTQVFTSNGTWTKASGVSKVRVSQNPFLVLQCPPPPG